MTGSLFGDDDPRRPRKNRLMLRWPSACGPEPSTRSSASRRSSPPADFLRNAIESDRIPSMIFWGPPGSGKTTLARIIAKTTRARFVPFSATSTSIKDIKTLMEEARKGGSSAARRRSSSSTRSTASTRRSRTRFCRTSRRATSR